MAKKAAKKRATAPKKPTPLKIWRASIHFERSSPIPAEFAQLINRLSRELKKPVWLLVQPNARDNEFHRVTDEVVERFIYCKKQLPSEPIALLINSPGGYARAAYRLAKLLRRQCGGFTAVVPAMAKSAATLLSLGASEIILGDEAELGPLDVQIYDPEREEQLSALDETQAVEALENAAMETADTLLLMMKRRTDKKMQTLMPEVLKFASEIMKPMFEKIDSVRFSQMSRALRLGEEYAYRLLSLQYERQQARIIASKLVSRYPEHGFVIDRRELCEEVGLPLSKNSDTLRSILDDIYPFMANFWTEEPSGICAIGQLSELEVPTK